MSGLDGAILGGAIVFVVFYVAVLVAAEQGAQRGCPFCVGLMDGLDRPRRWLAMLFQGRAVMWQPIDLHGGEMGDFIVYDGHRVGEAWFSPVNDGWWWANQDPSDWIDGQCYPTHWQPLPAPPSPAP